jgi:hypothetical protein
MSATFTPGPWVVTRNHPDPETAKSLVEIQSKATTDALGDFWSGTDIATIYAADPDKYPERAANARLIAAAPELLEALREILDLCAVGDVDENTEALGWGAVIRDAKAALAKATGSAS